MRQRPASERQKNELFLRRIRFQIERLLRAALARRHMLPAEFVQNVRGFQNDRRALLNEFVRPVA